MRKVRIYAVHRGGVVETENSKTIEMLWNLLQLGLGYPGSRVGRQIQTLVLIQRLLPTN